MTLLNIWLHNGVFLTIPDYFQSSEAVILPVALSLNLLAKEKSNELVKLWKPLFLSPGIRHQILFMQIKQTDYPFCVEISS